MAEDALESTQDQNLTTFLTQFFGHESYSTLQLAGDASARRYFRIVHNSDSYVLMVWEPFEDNGDYPFLSVLNFFARHGISVPQVLAKSPPDGLILLEDLGDLTLERKFWESQNQEFAAPYYQQALDQLFKIHFETSGEKSECTALRTEFNVDKFLWELNYGVDHLLAQFCQIELSSAEEKTLNSLFLSICTRLAQQPKIICHRDFHSRNIMIKLGQVKLIDFQDARLGPVQYDLVSLLKDSYVDLDQEHHDQLLNSYYERMVSTQEKSPSHQEFLEIYELQSLQRCFKACGSFASFYNLRQDTRYLTYLPKTLKRVQKSLDHFPEYKFFLDLMNHHDLFSQDLLSRDLATP